MERSALFGYRFGGSIGGRLFPGIDDTEVAGACSGTVEENVAGWLIVEGARVGCGVSTPTLVNRSE